MTEMNHWINTVSKEHVVRGVQGGFTQADHGKAGGLRRLAKDDWIVFYSPKTTLLSGEPLQAFTALGRIMDDEPFQVQMTPTFHPWRRKVEFFPCQETSIRPLIPELEFIVNKAKWGFHFRRGLFQISEQDFQRIATAMHVKAF